MLVTVCVGVFSRFKIEIVVSFKTTHVNLMVALEVKIRLITTIDVCTNLGPSIHLGGAEIFHRSRSWFREESQKAIRVHPLGTVNDFSWHSIKYLKGYFCVEQIGGLTEDRCTAVAITGDMLLAEINFLPLNLRGYVQPTVKALQALACTAFECVAFNRKRPS